LRAGSDTSPIVHFLELREPVRNDKALTHSRTNSSDDLRGIARPLGERSPTILVLATIRLRPQKLIQQITVGRMHLHAVEAEAARVLRGLHVRKLQFLEILPRHGMAVGASALYQSRGTPGRVARKR